MSDEKRIATVMAPCRAVVRNRFDKLYYLYEYVQGYSWQPIKDERGYAHSTSAYARLGRITSQENRKAVIALHGNTDEVS